MRDLITRTNIEWLYKLIKPKPSSRLALVVVATGAAVLVSPLWEPLIRAAARTFLGVDIDAPTNPWFGLALVFWAYCTTLDALGLRALTEPLRHGTQLNMIDDLRRGSERSCLKNT